MSTTLLLFIVNDEHKSEQLIANIINISVNLFIGLVVLNEWIQ